MMSLFIGQKTSTMCLCNGRACGGIDNVPKLEIEGPIWNCNRVH